jgi:hypothetical protein
MIIVRAISIARELHFGVRDRTGGGYIHCECAAVKGPGDELGVCHLDRMSGYPDRATGYAAWFAIGYGVVVWLQTLLREITGLRNELRELRK